jgi:aubergine
VLTRYNNKTYRIDDIVFDQSPTSTFTQGDKQVSYVEYYKTQYNIDIKDPKQPLLLSRKERRVSGQEQKQEFVFCLIPEICYLTGMTEEMRSDFKVMRDIATHTRVSPNQRALALTKFCENVSSHPEAKAVLKQWGLTLGMTPTTLQARALDVEQIKFANKTESAGDNADFNRHATNNEVLEAINLDNWLVIHTSKDAKFARNFIDCMERNSRPMGISVAKPQTHVLQNDRTEAYVQALRTLLNAKIQCVVLICPTSRDDRYAAIKRICCTEIPVPSQVGVHPLLFIF